MRWVFFCILAAAFMLVQITLVRVVVVRTDQFGLVGPDLLVLLAVTIAVSVRSSLDAMLAAWVLGFLLDITTSGGPGGQTVIGPMAISYTVAAFFIFRIREAFFRERWSIQALFAAVFCLATQWLWLTAQSLLTGDVGMSAYLAMLFKAVLVSLYTGLAMILLSPVVSWCNQLLIVTPKGRTRRSGR